MALEKYDFGGWATRNDILCADGRTIRRNAFKDNDGQVVPLVWNHQHQSVTDVLGHALLENRDEGVYAYCSFNSSPEGQDAKLKVMHGDLTSLSIYANKLKQKGGDVLHGIIREVSLVHAGANDGAVIDQILAHGADGEYEYVEDEAIIYTGEEIEINHSAESAEEEAAGEEPQKGKEEMAEEKTIKDIFDTLNDEQKNAVYAIIGEIAGGDDEDDEEGEEMKHNVFDEDDMYADDTLIHDGLNVIMNDIKRFGSLKDSYLEHAAEYGIDNIDFIQDEDRNINARPDWINLNPIGWVTVTKNGVHHTPFAKVRMIHADITEDAARAKGYLKGNRKTDQVIKLLRRSVGPCTLYAKQSFDRDDIVDLEFDAVPWIKDEMLLKLDEEEARAILFGDGRQAADPDKVDDSCVIPIMFDDDLYTIKYEVDPAQGESVEEALIDGCMKALDDYEGSGNTIAYLEQKQVTRMRLLKDQFGHRLYKNDEELASAMGVGKIVRVPASIMPNGHYGLVVDLSDYNIGDKDAGKRKGFFDDFDIDYNKYKYLTEERISGALIRPHSAIALKVKTNG